MLVAIHDVLAFLPRHAQRHDLGVEAALGLRAGRSLLAAQGEGILLLAADPVLFGQALGRFSHHHLRQRAQEPVLDHGVHERLVAHAVAPARPGQQIGHAAHGLDTSGQHHVRVTVPDGPVREIDRLEAAGAGHVDGGGRDLLGDARAPGDLTGHVGTGAGLSRAAEEDGKKARMSRFCHQVVAPWDDSLPSSSIQGGRWRSNSSSTGNCVSRYCINSASGGKNKTASTPARSRAGDDSTA